MNAISTGNYVTPKPYTLSPMRVGVDGRGLEKSDIIDAMSAQAQAKKAASGAKKWSSLLGCFGEPNVKQGQ